MSFKISVVTATLNRCEWLPRCIQSVAAQSYPDKEHIIIDGGSTDGTVALLEELTHQYPHLRWISEKDDSLSEAFNKGLDLATGDCIGVLGDDDFYEPQAFELVAGAFERNAQAGVVAGNCRHVRTDGTEIMTQRAKFSNRRELIEFWRHWGGRVTLPAPSSFIRREVIQTVGGFETGDRYAMDYHHWIKITAKFPVVTINQTLANFRSDEGTISFSQNRKQQAETLAISRRYWNESPAFFRQMLFSYWFYGCGIASLRKIGRRLSRAKARREDE